MNRISKKTEDTKEIAKTFLARLKFRQAGATMVGLSGELGTGKTTFVQFLARELGVKRKVASPTFVIMKRYAIKNSKYKNLFHLDAYRLKNEKELFHLGWEEVLSKKENLVFIEWPENVIKALPKKYYKIKITHTKEGHRKFEIKNA